MDKIRGDYNQYLRTYQKSISQLDKVQKIEKTGKGRGGEGAKKKDSLELTGLSKEIKVAREKISQLDSQEKARVNELKESIQSGTYDVSGDEIAGKIIETAREVQFDREV
ncbi:flagellar biosynthesis anti-sigma factor FlgM [Natranaerobius thermophilus]|uniref:Negative regulator of flagellin synthesis n=1 Tax=Natranaerobius thermophilus (strain ATCC BAA-1301 / DSM 18059 / JW/NM-WN-LF) TaxID=457570 RepID=B2A836_NATTJ|nr:flagellar biosynthesis anti-sigma factor FlgM [Natranaerobius thermophilus]ACB85804.1 hypothetical protein Nther_2238 [Natranaerobius thermophilus JW/NM-WN-LF]